MAAVQNLCDKAIYLSHGKIMEQGAPNVVLQSYLKDSAAITSLDLHSRNDRQGNGKVRFVSFAMLNRKGEESASVQSGEHVTMRFVFESFVDTEISKLHFAIGIDDEFGVRIAHLSNEVTNEIFEVVNSNHQIIDIHIPKLPLREGSYSFTLYSTVKNEVSDYLQNAGSFFVESGDFYNTGKLPPEGQGTFFIEHYFKLN